nr:exo-alpha-sialidase [Anaerolineae bacterium]
MSRLLRALCALIAAGLTTGLLMLIASHKLVADGPPEIGTPVPVAVTSGTDSGYPTIAVAPDGTRHVVWEEVVSPTTYLYHATSSDGIIWTLPITVSEGDSPALAIAANGAPQLVFARYVSPTVNVYATRYLTDGWRAPQRLSSGAYNASAPDIAVAPGGTLYAAWVERPTGQYVIYVALSNDDGATWPIILPTVSVSGTVVLGAPHVTVGSDGVAHLVWQKKDSALATYDVFHKQRDPTTGQWDVVAANLSANSDAHSFGPAVAATGGRAYVLWEESNAIRASRGFTLTWTTPITLSTAGVEAADPTATMAGGVLHTAWDEGTVIRTAFGWPGSPVNLAQDSNGIRDVALSGGPEGMLHAAWSQGPAGTADIYYTYRRLAQVFLPLTLRAFP